METENRAIIGMRISHKKFGEGNIIDYQIKDENDHILVHFDFMDNPSDTKAFIYPDSVGSFISFLEDDYDISLDLKTAEARKIGRIIREHKIKNLLHVTRIENLKSILEEGIIPRSDIPANAVFNDKDRYDGRTDCNCLSVERPNKDCFKRYIRDSLEPLTFVCIQLRPDLLLDSNTKYYCPHNAATRSIFLELMGDGYSSSDDFENMFADVVKVESSFRGPITIRRTGDLNDNHTTSVQAEILYKGVIKPEYITGIDFPDMESLREFNMLLKEKNIVGTIKKHLSF